MITFSSQVMLISLSNLVHLHVFKESCQCFVAVAQCFLFDGLAARKITIDTFHVLWQEKFVVSDAELNISIFQENILFA